MTIERTLGAAKEVRMRRWTAALDAIRPLDDAQLIDLVEEIAKKLDGRMSLADGDTDSTNGTPQGLLALVREVADATNSDRGSVGQSDDDAATDEDDGPTNRAAILQAVASAPNPPTTAEIKAGVKAIKPGANLISIPAEIARLTKLKKGALLAIVDKNKSGHPRYALTAHGKKEAGVV